MQNDTRIAVDLAKAVFEVAVSDRPGGSRRERLPRSQFLTFFAQHPAATVVMEACGSLTTGGGSAPALPVRPYVRRNKTDRTDAKGILEASRNDDIRRFRSRPSPAGADLSSSSPLGGWRRTARLNTLRGCSRAGCLHPVGAAVVPAVWIYEDADSDFPDALRPVFAEACHEIREIEARIKQVERQLEAMAQQLPVVAHLLTIPGIGLLTATALFAFIGNIHRFPSGRHLASWLGLTPREYSSGLKRRLGGISKRGDGYLRTLLIHGARSVLLHARKDQPDHLREWAHQLAQTHVHNKAAVAVANKMARIVWAVWSRLEDYGQARKDA